MGGRLRLARQAKGMSVRGLARAADVSASLISQIETGKTSPSVSTLYAITTALQISIEEVFGDTYPDASEPGAGTDVPDGAPGARAAGEVATGAAPAQSIAGESLPPLTIRRRSTNGSASDRSAESPVSRGLRLLGQSGRVGPVVAPDQREVLHLDSGVTWELLGKLPDTHIEFLRITYAPGGSSSGAGVLMRHVGTEYGHVLSGRLTLSLGFDTFSLNPGDSVSFDCSIPHAYSNHGDEPAVGVWFVVSQFR
jgi:transcriptional regulator with XRE-family HTH domain/quercetin dioxygenase-like cupin family protein